MATSLIVAATAGMSVAQWRHPGLLPRLERTPAELHGQPWRILTSLFVQDGGVLGTLSNLAFLVVLGVAAEQVLALALPGRLPATRHSSIRMGLGR